LLAGFACIAAAPEWTVLISGVTARFRGVSAVNENVAWASGANGTVLRTADGGTTWQRLPVDGAAALDFRDIDAVNERTAYVLSIGPGDASRIYKTSDAGATWNIQFKNTDPNAFYDAMAFWSPNHGIVVSDSVDGRFVIRTTEDGGRTWPLIPADRLPPALPSEGAFAASGTNIAVHGNRHVWIGMGSGRVLRSADAGKSWAVSATGIAASESAGIFSIAFRDALHGVAVGGDYRKETATGNNAAVTSDGGKTWRLVEGLGGFRSVVTWAGTNLIAVGPSGADISNDRGTTWRPIPGPGYHTFSVAKGKRIGWGAGEKGTLGRLRW